MKKEQSGATVLEELRNDDDGKEYLRYFGGGESDLF
jgi:hypothetical protein